MFASYKEAAARSGLTMSPPDPGFFASNIELSGRLDGHNVHVTRAIGVHMLATQVWFEPAFDLGLSVAPAGQPSGTLAVSLIPLRRLGRLFSGKDLHVGDAELDDAFAIHADDEPRAEALLLPARDALLAWYRSGIAFDLDDGGLWVRRRSSSPFADTPDVILGDLTAALELARILEAQRAKVPPASALAATVQSFSALAAARSLALSVTPLAVWGTIGGRAAWARAVRVGERSYRAEAMVSPSTPFPFTDMLRPRAGGIRQAEPGLDASFEEAFEIDGPDLADRLTPEARAALLALHRSGHEVRLRPSGVTVSAPIGAEPFPIEATIEHCDVVIAAIDASLRSSAVYR